MTLEWSLLCLCVFNGAEDQTQGLVFFLYIRTQLVCFHLTFIYANDMFFYLW
jgi:hypothetical protein